MIDNFTYNINPFVTRYSQLLLGVDVNDYKEL